MPLSEFSLIQRYFSQGTARRADVRLGVGDDAALLAAPGGDELAMSMDTLVSGVHFPEDTPPADIAYKALAVNLSDMAAMGAEPAWMLLALTLPEVNEHWLEQFSQGLRQLASAHGVTLVGGDTTRGPLSISVQITGRVPAGQALRRRGARPGDSIYVTGQLGDAGVGLQLAQGRCPLALDDGQRDYFLQRLHRPTPRVAAGLALRGLASAAIDISDGVIADLGHILDASGVGARVDVEQLPVAAAVGEMAEWWRLPLTAGDDYELCFTAPPERAAGVAQRFGRLACPCARIGVIDSGSGLRLFHRGAGIDIQALKGYRHFG